MRTSGNITTRHGIKWYYEQEGSGPDVVLIPDGMGECVFFDKPMPIIAAAGFRVTTFDMPGMGRSRNAPPETYEKVTPQKLAGYVIGIIDELKIDKATFWGCSSGGSTVLALVAGYPDRVRNGLAHETPTYDVPALSALPDAPDDVIVKAMSESAPNFFMGNNTEAWYGLGEEVHARLRETYPRWARGYIRTLGCSFPVNKDDLKGKPLEWSVGADTPTAVFFDNIVTATQLGQPVGVIPGRHFPYLSDPEPFAAYVVEKTKKYL